MAKREGPFRIGQFVVQRNCGAGMPIVLRVDDLEGRLLSCTNLGPVGDMTKIYRKREVRSLTARERGPARRKRNGK